MYLACLVRSEIVFVFVVVEGVGVACTWYDFKGFTKERCGYPRSRAGSL